MTIIAKNPWGGNSEELIRLRQGYGGQVVNSEDVRCKTLSSSFNLHSSLSFLLATVLALAIGSAWAALWYGAASDTKWSMEGNWENNVVPSSSDSLAFRRDNPPNKTATLDDLYIYSGNLHVGRGSSVDSPYIFEAYADNCGLTIKDDVWLGYYEDGGLWLKSGVYKFSTTKNKKLHIGEAKSGFHDFWLRVGNGLSAVSLEANDVYVDGLFTFSGARSSLRRR